MKTINLNDSLHCLHINFCSHIVSLLNELANAVVGFDLNKIIVGEIYRKGKRTNSKI